MHLDYRLEVNSNLKAITYLFKCPSKHHSKTVGQSLNSQATLCTVERSFSMLPKLQAKHRHFTFDNV